MFGVFFYVSLYVQGVLGYSPTEDGASFLPRTVLIIVLAPQMGRLSDRMGPRPFVTGGMLVLAGSLVLFARMGTDETFWDLLPAMILGGIGMAAAMAPVTAAAMHSVPPDKAGVGSAVLNSARQVGGSLGIAIMGAIVAAGASSATAAGNPAESAFMNGFHHALAVAAVIVIVGALIAAATLRRVDNPEPTPEATFAEVG
jgi:MFS family permease